MQGGTELDDPGCWVGRILLWVDCRFALDAVVESVVMAVACCGTNVFSLTSMLKIDTVGILVNDRVTFVVVALRDQPTEHAMGIVGIEDSRLLIASVYRECVVL
jgi:hypothetical protein